jgi:hypothetical protein
MHSFLLRCSWCVVLALRGAVYFSLFVMLSPEGTLFQKILDTFLIEKFVNDRAAGKFS